MIEFWHVLCSVSKLQHVQNNKNIEKLSVCIDLSEIVRKQMRSLPCKKMRK